MVLSAVDLILLFTPTIESVIRLGPTKKPTNDNLFLKIVFYHAYRKFLFEKT
jgi:hypothetical protein